MKFLADENFNNDILRGVWRRIPDASFTRVQDTGIAGADDPRVLEYAAEQGYIILSHDLNTMRGYFYDRITAGLPTPGLCSLYISKRRLARLSTRSSLLSSRARSTSGLGEPPIYHSVTKRLVSQMNKGRNRGELTVGHYLQLPNIQQQIKLANIGRRNMRTVILAMWGGEVSRINGSDAAMYAAQRRSLQNSNQTSAGLNSGFEGRLDLMRCNFTEISVYF